MNPFEIEEVAAALLRLARKDEICMLATVSRMWRRLAKRELRVRARAKRFATVEEFNAYTTCRMTTQMAVSSLPMLEQSGITKRKDRLETFKDACLLGAGADVVAAILDGLAPSRFRLAELNPMELAYSTGYAEVVELVEQKFGKHPIRAQCFTRLANKGNMRALYFLLRQEGNVLKKYDKIALIEAAFQGGRMNTIHELANLYGMRLKPSPDCLIASIKFREVLEVYRKLYGERNMRLGLGMLRVACAVNNFEALEWVLEKQGRSLSDDNVIDKIQLGEMLVSCDAEQANRLLDAYATADRQLPNASDLIVNLCKKGKWELAKTLSVRLGVDMRSHQFAGQVFSCAVLSGAESTACVLGEPHESMEYTWVRGMWIACLNGDLQTAQLILEHMGRPPNWADVGSHMRDTMFINACETDDVATLDWLVRSFAVSERWLARLARVAESAGGYAVARWIRSRYAA